MLSSAVRIAQAVPGPDSVAVIANDALPESVALAQRYADARSIPARQVCRLEMSTSDTVDLATYRAELLEPFESCLTDAGVLDRIEAVVLAKGVPLRVTIPVEGGNQRVSTAAALATWKSRTSAGGSRDILGEAPGERAMCNDSPCTVAEWQNPFRDREEPFRAGWTRIVFTERWSPLLVTALNARTFEDAARLVRSATIAEALPAPSGHFVFMEGRDPARGILDAEFPGVVAELQALGFDAETIEFDTDRTGLVLAGFAVGTAQLGTTIEGNTYLPGSIVDNLTSFGARPENFEETGELQVSIARWVARGVAGVHGTTDEPLNNSFPSRQLFVDYAEGGTLAEAYFRRLPFAYWRNLVLGDAMAAPFAVRPSVEVAGIVDGGTVAGATPVTVESFDGLGRGIASLTVFVDGVEVAGVAGSRIDVCLVPPMQDDLQVLVVAQSADDGSPGAWHQPKGWVELTIDGAAGPETCAQPDAGVSLPDAGRLDARGPDAARADARALDARAAVDAALDAGILDAAGAADAAPAGERSEGSGCRCGSPETRVPGVGITIFLAAVLGRRRKSRRSEGRVSLFGTIG